MLEAIGFAVILSAWVAAAVMFAEDVQQAAGVVITTTAETIVATGKMLPVTTATGKAVIRGWVQLTVGTGTTAVTLAIYRGTAIVAGNLVAAKQAMAGSFAAGSTAPFELNLVDPLANVSDAQYCLSVTQTGAGGNGTAVQAMIDTKILSG